MWKKSALWRKTNKIDQILNDEMPDEDKIFNFYDFGFFQCDKSGRPIYIHEIGKVKFTKLLESISPEIFILRIVKDMEFAIQKIFPALSKQLKIPIEQIILIIDLKGIKLTTLSNKQVLQTFNTLVQTLQDNYPLLLNQGFLLNAPMMFESTWENVKDQLSKYTAEKIKLTGTKTDNDLLQLVDPNNLPLSFGGTYSGYIDFGDGPWREEYQFNLHHIQDIEQIPLDEIGEINQVEFNINLGEEESKEFNEQEEDKGIEGLRNELSKNLPHIGYVTKNKFAEEEVSYGQFNVENLPNASKINPHRGIAQTPMNTQADEDEKKRNSNV